MANTNLSNDIALFDAEFYLLENPDVAAAINAAAAQGVIITPLEHYVLHGQAEGRAPYAVDPDPVDPDPVDPVEPDVSNTVLTVGQDYIEVAGDNNVVTAPVVQNFLGAVTNTLETGDVILGEAGAVGNTLAADIALSVTGTVPVGPAISATTENIDIVQLRAQTSNDDFVDAAQGNFSHIDAERFKGVKEWWSTDSRATIQIEDVRTAPEATLIGLKDSDPFVGFHVYFDPQQLQAGSVASNSQLTLTLEDTRNPESLAEVPVNGVSFSLDGESYTLQSEAMGAATTHTAFNAALQAAIAETEGLEGVTATLNANNTITLNDPAGQDFAIGSWKFINDDVPAAGNILWNQQIGSPDIADQLIATNIVLDNVGRTSQGGSVDVGSLGDGGVQQFDVQVGASSWVSSLESNNYLGGRWNTDAYLEVVNVKHAAGANGDLTIGYEFLSTDDRVVAGLTDVRELNAATFSGDLKAGINITAAAEERYLNEATDTVEFDYKTGSGDDNLTVWVEAGVASDRDFALNVDLGAGDDRLNLDTDGGNLNSISVNGGTGNNTIELANTNQGINANTTFAEFANFQNYIVAGIDDTTHVFGNASGVRGVENVVIATDAFTVVDDLGMIVADIDADTTLRSLEAETSLTISGKNQTLGNDSNENQDFGVIAVQNSRAETLTVTLDNTARLDGTLFAERLDIDLTNAQFASTTTRTLDLVSAGQRDTSNVVGQINAQNVGTFNITGTQNLTTWINTAANQQDVVAARNDFVVDASELEANVNLTVTTDIINRVAETAIRTNTITGAEGGSDTLTLKGVDIYTREATTISEFETINFDLTGGGVFNALRTTDVEQYNINSTGAALELINLSNDENVAITAPAVFADVTLRGEGADINVALSGGLGLGNGWANGTGELTVGGYTTANLTLARDEDYNFQFLVADSAGNTRDDANYKVNATVVTNELVLKGGGGIAQATLNNLDNELSTIDISAYAGKVTGSMVEQPAGAALTSDVTVIVGASDLEWDVLGGNQLIEDTNYNTTFVFTSSASVGKSEWVINDFITDEDTPFENHSILDLSGLGINAYNELLVNIVDGNAIITSQNETLANNVTWEIELVGVSSQNELSASDNFIFA